MIKKSFMWLIIFLISLTACASPQTTTENKMSSKPDENQQIIVGIAPEKEEKSPQSEAKAELIDFNCTKLSYSDQLTCFGVVKNSCEIAETVMVILTTRDEKGNLDLRESTSVYQSALLPGMVGPFQFYNLAITDCEKCEIMLSPMAADWAELYTSFSILSQKINPLEYMNGFEIIGEIQNTGNLDMEYPAISGALFDENNRIISVGIGMPDINPLPAGQVSTFSILFTEVAEGVFKTYQIFPVVGMPQ